MVEISPLGNLASRPIMKFKDRCSYPNFFYGKERKVKHSEEQYVHCNAYNIGLGQGP